ncbi:hypothetical protein NH340_JMT04566 [Sarcoptes scabiei]|nr:hypothetical protein NH340_JMT04566 [Sarcoptes scabiei]
MCVNLVSIIIWTLWLFLGSQQCAIHDMLKTMPQTSNIDIQVDNQTMLQIFHSTSSLIQELEGGDSVLIQLLNPTDNRSSLALIVKNFMGETGDLLNQYQMYYVNLLEDHTTGYRLYWNIVREFFRNNLNMVFNQMRNHINIVRQMVRPNPNNSIPYLDSTINKLLAMPGLIRAMYLSKDIEERVIELSINYVPNESNRIDSSDTNRTDSSNFNQNFVKNNRRLIMKIIAVFNGKFFSNRSSLAKNGLIVMDKGIRIEFLGQQLNYGTIDLFRKESR